MVGVFHEPDKFGSIGLEGFLLLNRGRYCIRRCLQQCQPLKVFCVDQCLQRKSIAIKECFCCRNGFQNPRDQFFFIHGRVRATVAIHIRSVIGQGFPKRFDDSYIIDNQAVALTLGYAVSAGNRLHQRVRLQGLVQIQAGQAFYIETGQPHSANKYDAEWVGRIFEFFIQFPLFHLFTVIFDV